MSKYPSTADEMVDRLLVDRPFLIRTVVNDNYPAVRANFLEQLQDDPARVSTPEKLTTELLWWDRTQGADIVDPVLNVPYRSSANSAVLDAAMVKMCDVVIASGATVKAGDGTDNNGSVWGGLGSFAGGFMGGIAAIGNAYANIANGENAIEAQERVASQAVAAQSAADQARIARNATLVRWGIGIGAVVIIIIAIVYLRTHRTA